MSSSLPPMLDAPMATKPAKKASKTVSIKRKSMNLNNKDAQKDYILSKLTQESAKIATQNRGYRFNPETWKNVTPVEGTALLFGRYCDQMYGEIEAKLGKWVNNTFESGVSNQDFQRILQMLSSYSKWTNLEESRKWNTIIDYILMDNIRVSKTCNGNQFIRKTLMDNITLKCPERPYNVRVSLKQETPCEVQLPKEPSMVRVKKRRSFVHRDIWRFDLSYIWSGRDEQEAQSKPPVYEVECEFVGDKNMVRTETKYYASSILEKMMDLLGRETPMHFEIINATFPSPFDFK